MLQTISRHSFRFLDEPQRLRADGLDLRQIAGPLQRLFNRHGRRELLSADEAGDGPRVRRGLDCRDDGRTRPKVHHEIGIEIGLHRTGRNHPVVRTLGRLVTLGWILDFVRLRPKQAQELVPSVAQPIALVRVLISVLALGHAMYSGVSCAFSW